MDHIRIPLEQSSEHVFQYISQGLMTILIMSYSPVNYLPSNPKQPLIQKPRSFQEIAVDLCSYASRTYLIIVDYFIDWPAVISLDHGTSTQAIVPIRQSFFHTTIPDMVWSDGGPQFTAIQRLCTSLRFCTYQVISLQFSK